jgi:hypothetical protein
MGKVKELGRGVEEVVGRDVKEAVGRDVEEVVGRGVEEVVGRDVTCNVSVRHTNPKPSTHPHHPQVPCIL